jgi:hypothetical protein
VCVGDQEWNVYRRYTHFHDLHKQVRHVFPDAELALPAKSSLSRKSEKFVEQRRAALEAYMRCGFMTPFVYFILNSRDASWFCFFPSSCVVKLCVSQPRSPLAINPNKETLCDAIPFLKV